MRPVVESTREKVKQMRLKKASISDIAQACGVTKQRVSQIVKELDPSLHFKYDRPKKPTLCRLCKVEIKPHHRVCPECRPRADAEAKVKRAEAVRAFYQRQKKRIEPGVVKDGWLVVSFERRDRHQNRYWNCECVKCGEKKTIVSGSLATKVPKCPACTKKEEES